MGNRDNPYSASEISKSLPCANGLLSRVFDIVLGLSLCVLVVACERGRFFQDYLNQRVFIALILLVFALGKQTLGKILDCASIFACAYLALLYSSRLIVVNPMNGDRWISVDAMTCLIASVFVSIWTGLLMVQRLFFGQAVPGVSEQKEMTQ